MEVCPEHRAVHVPDHVHQMMVVVPVDADEHEAEHVAEEPGNEGRERRRVRPVRDFQLQHQDGDDDRDDAVAEGFQPSPGHFTRLAGRAAMVRTAPSMRRARVSGFFAPSIASAYSRWCE